MKAFVVTNHFPNPSGGWSFREKLVTILDEVDELDSVFLLTGDSAQVNKENLAGASSGLTVKDLGTGPGRGSLRGLMAADRAAARHILERGRQGDLAFFMCGNLMPRAFRAAGKRSMSRIFLMSGIGGWSALHYHAKQYRKKCSRTVSSLAAALQAATEQLIIVRSTAILLESPRLDWLVPRRFGGTIAPHAGTYVDVSRFRPAPPQALREYDLLFFGRVSQEKGIYDFIEAAEHAKRKLPQLRIAIAGAGPDNEEVKARLARANLDAVFLGRIPDHQVPSVLCATRYLIFPTPPHLSGEGLPNVILESMACGTPVISRRVGALPDLIRNGINGVLTDDRIIDLAEAIVAAPRGGRAWQVMSTQARNDVVQQYSFKAAVRRWKAIISRLVEP